MQEKEISHSHKKIFYRTIGEGPVVVLLHGVPFDGNLWDNQFNAFPGYKLIVPDLPGSGRSEMIEDMSTEGMAECVKDIIVHETASLYFKSGEPHSVIVIGHSMGGYIALALAEKHPELLNGFGLFHSTAYSDSDEKKEGRKKAIELLKEKGTSEFAKNSLPNLFSTVTKEQNAKLIEEQISVASKFSANALIAYQTAMMQRKDRREILKNTQVPVLFTFGRHDNVVVLKDGLEQCALTTSSLVHVLENSGHTGMKEEPEKSNRILLEYLSLEKAAHSY
jgi:pimeloyl-ACP methyl ester carboxylesterase